MTRTIITMTAIATILIAAPAAPAQESASGSLLARRMAEDAGKARAAGEDGTVSTSLFAIDPPDPRVFQPHDLVQIVVRETVRLNKKSEFDTEKEWSAGAEVKAWPTFTLQDLVNLQAFAGRTTNLPKLDVETDRDFEATGEKKELEDVTARLTAEVIEIRPNGNLVLEARTTITMDKEESVFTVTGICRAEDVTLTNTILSTQVHDLVISRKITGELERNNRKGIFPTIVEFLFGI